MVNVGHGMNRPNVFRCMFQSLGASLEAQIELVVFLITKAEFSVQVPKKIYIPKIFLEDL